MSDLNLPTGVTEGPEKTVEEPKILPDSIKSVVENKGDDLTADLSTREQKETSDGTGEWLDLYLKQNDASEALKQRAKENNIKDVYGNELILTPACLKFDDDMIIYSALGEPVHLFQKTDSSFKEIPLLPGKVFYDGQGNGLIPTDIEKIQSGIYYVKLSHFKNGRIEDRGDRWNVHLGKNNESYFIDKTGKVLEQIGKLGTTLDGNDIHNKEKMKDYWGFWHINSEEIDYYGKTQSKSTIIYNDNMEKMFTVPDTERYSLKYCDNQVCICQDTKQYIPEKYVIIDNTGIVAEGTMENLKSDKRMEGFIKEENKRLEEQQKDREKQEELEKIPYEERFAPTTHIKIKYGGDNKEKAHIENDEGKILYEIGDVLELNTYYDFSPTLEISENAKIKIVNWKSDSNVLFIQEIEKGIPKKSIFINKKTGDKLEFDGYKGRSCYQEGKLFKVFYNDDAEVYDENLNSLGVAKWVGSDMFNHGLQLIVKEEDGEEKFYLYDRVNGKQLCEVSSEKREDVIQRILYEDDNWTRHFIIKNKDGNLIEANPRKKTNN